MSRHPLAIVCALAFTVGAAAAGLLFRQHPGGGRDVQASAVRASDAGSEEGAETPVQASQTIEAARAEEGRTASDAEGDAAEPDGGAVRPAAKGRGRGAAPLKARGAARGHVRVASGRAASGGGGVARYAVGGVRKTGEGVKKTGAAVGRTLGKIGGVFHD